MTADRLKYIFKLFFTAVLVAHTFHGTAQRSPNARKVLSQITSIPDRFTKGYKWDGKKDMFEGADSTYRVVARMDTFAIIRLMPFLSDTTETTIPNTCDGGYLTYGQLAFMLIHDIEHVPLYFVTHMQFDTLFDCGWLPDGFLAYIKDNPEKFKRQYDAYFKSKERQRYLREERRDRRKASKTKRVTANASKESTHIKK